MLLGMSSIVNMVTKRERLRGMSCFLLGFAMMMTGWAYIGVLVEVFGFFNLFGYGYHHHIHLASYITVLRDHVE